ncbi:macrolide family glycosyltransferase [Pseudonocardia sp. HH130630-07]|uniref:macrolide family glycosyltransferase n=1 Tax=Pseudonocardia sp. HH130630-07 TaxID=1690815 RepID=UPI000814D101|nr:macrolide family glycosyltransferase [Pseudonocardia sp. HH130630-07]ANY07873.1 glycosyl transferase [Pseudonocardia sp. HH130630-07]
MAHILMSTTAAHGHVHPNLPVVAELVARGHRVTYPVPERFAEPVAATGAAPLRIRTDLPDPARGEQWPDGGVAAMRLFSDEARSAYAQIADALQYEHPDLVCYDGSGWAGHALSRVWGIPRVELAPHMVAWEGFEQEMAEAFAFLDAPDGLAWRAELDAWLDEVGAGVGNREFLGRPDRSVVLIPEAMQPNLDRVDRERHTFVGPVIGDRSHQGLWPKPRGPLLLVSLGSAYTDRPGFWRDAIAAMHGTGWTTVLAVGPHVDRSELGEIPDDVRVAEWVPQLAVLAHASAFVTHAGMGGCAEGLWHGVPMVAVPQAVDQFGNAARIAELGVGEHLPAEQVTPEALREAVLRVASSDAVAGRCAEQKAVARAAGGAAQAADVVESLLPPARCLGCPGGVCGR